MGAETVDEVLWLKPSVDYVVQQEHGVAYVAFEDIVYGLEICVVVEHVEAVDDVLVCHRLASEAHHLVKD